MARNNVPLFSTRNTMTQINPFYRHFFSYKEHECSYLRILCKIVIAVFY